MPLFDFWKKKKESLEETLDSELDKAAGALSEELEKAETVAAERELPPTGAYVPAAEADEGEEPAPSPHEEAAEEGTEKKSKAGLFSRLMQGLGKTRSVFNGQVDGVFRSSRKVDDDLYDELEEALIMADIGGATSMEIVEELRARVKEKRINDAEEAKTELKSIIGGILGSGDSELHLDTTPTVVLVIGVNGVGKTTTIGKLTNKLKNEGKSVVLAAADTFRAAAADQLEIWAERNGVQLVRLTEGADPAAVIFDGCSAAKSRRADVLICDTAGRLHNKKNLMEELKKIYRVIERELPGSRKEVLLVLDATTGQNAVNQAEEFNKAAELTGIVLTKLDGTAKGGIVIQIIQKLGVPVKFIGVGEQIDDLQPFDAEAFAAALFG